MDPCLGHLDPIESVLKKGLPTCWISRAMWTQFFKHLGDDVSSCWKQTQQPISHFESLAGTQEVHSNISVGSECAASCRCRHTPPRGEASSVLRAVYQQQCRTAPYPWHSPCHRTYCSGGAALLTQLTCSSSACPLVRDSLGVSAGHSAGGGDKTLVLRKIVSDMCHQKHQFRPYKD